MYRYDNLQAFDGSPIEVEFDTEGKEITRALVVFNNGAIVKEYLNPISPLYVELDETDTGKLKYRNIINLIGYDSLGRKLTFDGQYEFIADKEVYVESNI